MNTMKTPVIVSLLVVLFVVGISLVPVQAENLTIPQTLITKMDTAVPRYLSDTLWKELAYEYTPRINLLDSNDLLVQKYLPRLQEKILIVYQSFNNADRYNSKLYHYRAATELSSNFELYVHALEHGVDPVLYLRGSYIGGAYISRAGNYVVPYQFSIPASYSPSQAMPIVGCYQSNPDPATVSHSSYIFAWGLEDPKEGFMDIAKDLHVDPFGTYLASHSDGALAAARIVANIPHGCAGYVPLSSGIREPIRYDTWQYVRYLQNVPVLVMCGTGDPFIANNQAVYQEISAAGGIVEWRSWVGYHEQSVLAEPERFQIMTDFFDKYRLYPYPQTVTHLIENIKFTRAFWVNGLLNKNYTATNDLFMLGVSFKITAHKAANTIEIEYADDHISGFDFLLNDSIVSDITQPVKVVYGSDTLFNAIVPVSGTLTVHLYDSSSIPASLPPQHKAAGYFSNMEDTLLWEELNTIEQNYFGVTTPMPFELPAPQTSVETDNIDHQVFAITAGPNPFNPAIKIAVSGQVAGSEKIEINIYNIRGKLVQKLPATSCSPRIAGETGQPPAGFIWDAGKMPSGTYIIRAVKGKQAITKQITLLK
ncbi:MAG: hypothetical protein A2487_11280 [Candidatus Raymondbacteria bacterium RifOxyC12_full_50_8]|uniref:Secretion system C-terminal sorting domain-containing protein n=1 Tax=Candidatus Raymondbacteria bacterium RIFOXYD12_FULL_49_13 TaxID=1817890 RepID=A0A1F7FL88_UNCRA|nr:MAG: hypothetical protein A2248_11155 [Candidatus Raymondbacteria bacterium RIFOXYA2_FULL_49_16]OGJ95367.1 MAG: hypothetical protein A2453_09285 [Candidatus Raymondbacteria bacterium RIFOXYC2_FULL_50_21]OGK01900.1 MAG: hypothetical protein A2350_08845 [Candidatus Raymondbacteria bacterium RifOxyB12_full_50_8]OGK03999.1 MAG: hypothetical protein A2487_11280 [Candidatus Raymondbacteria bacterium RifOxyC12_full_50_8]OGK07383.1 MAG: hypothetical protein A2519_21185 [Candidatus Raymondbacteria ba